MFVKCLARLSLNVFIIVFFEQSLCELFGNKQFLAVWSMTYKPIRKLCSTALGYEISVKILVCIYVAGKCQYIFTLNVFYMYFNLFILTLLWNSTIYNFKMLTSVSFA